MKKIEYDCWYRPQDDELRQIAEIQTLANWRYQEIGPSWHTANRRILYKGSDIIAFLESNRVETRAA